MEIVFHLNYHTAWGERLFICGNVPALGDGVIERAVPMHYNGEGNWIFHLSGETLPEVLSYRYLVRDIATLIAEEQGDEHSHRLRDDIEKLWLYDRWRGIPPEKAFYASAFTEVVFKRKAESRQPASPHPAYLTIEVSCPGLTSDQQLAITGEGETLGDWDPARAVPMDGSRAPVWSVTLDGTDPAYPFAYKFLIRDGKNGRLLGWESGDNRSVFTPASVPGEETVISTEPVRNPLPRWRGAGTAIPVFSLRSEHDFGIGEFEDIRLLVDWAVQTGQRIIQLLPVNDTTLTRTWMDSYPYNANSTFALHPLYLRIDELGTLSDPQESQRYESLRRLLNSLPEVDYDAVSKAKWDYFRSIYAERGEETLGSEPYKAFFRENSHWLVPYAAFSYLRDFYGTADFGAWETFGQYDRRTVAELCAEGNPHHREIALYYYLQYHLHRQLTGVRDYARSRGVVLKGDIPIGISRQSVDAWSESRLFNLDSQAGAPPDDFSASGQNWGFPTYNWVAMEREGYHWWRSRLHKMAHYFDAYRIDHILGFFRIWEIPESGVNGLLGHFNPALPLSADEMRAYGFYFNEARHESPYIRRYFLYALFGKQTEAVIENYLTDTGFESYRLKPEFDTQRKIADCFAGRTDPKSEQLREGLFRLTEEVLFVPDPYRKGYFHPRIAAQNTYSYDALNDYEKACYNRIYDDFFYHRHNEFWKGEALKKLPPLLAATPMLVCGEDLGMIPHSVPEVMQQLQILSLEIFRMPKESQQPFADPRHYPYLSVCSTSTHDMAPLRAWWEEDRTQAQTVYNALLGEAGEAPFYCEPWICERIIDLHLQSPAMLALLPLQDWLSEEGALRRELPQEERINEPSIPRHYWRYRMHLTLETLLEQKEFNRKLRKQIEACGR